MEAAQAGARLDRFLAGALPDLGLRARRRLIERGQILVNGQRRPPALKLKAGDQVHICAKKPDCAPSPSLLAIATPYCYFYKPAGLHSAVVAGSEAPALEAIAPDLLPEDCPRPVFLQRLDFQTSGIVSGALNEDAAQNFRWLEKLGLCRKYYLARLSGRLPGNITASQPLNTRNRKHTRPLPGEAPKARQTVFIPLDYSPAPGNCGQTLALCQIYSGQRHQIRAHAQAIGHPLLGDEEYGGGGGGYCLEHFYLSFPGHACLLQRPGSMYAMLPDETRGRIDQIITAPDSPPGAPA